MKVTLVMFMLSLTSLSFGQSPVDASIAQQQSRSEMLMAWLEDLNEKGVEVTNDSILISKEFQRVLNSAEYRELLYPKTYTWEQTTAFMQNQMLKQTFWYFINLYSVNDTNKQLVLKSVITYDTLFKMDELLVSAFYTYSFMDPEISVIVDGSPEVIHPDVLEAKLRDVKEIVGYVLKNRALQKN